MPKAKRSDRSRPLAIQNLLKCNRIRSQEVNRSSRGQTLENLHHSRRILRIYHYYPELISEIYLWLNWDQKMIREPPKILNQLKYKKVKNLNKNVKSQEAHQLQYHQDLVFSRYSLHQKPLNHTSGNQHHHQSAAPFHLNEAQKRNT